MTRAPWTKWTDAEDAVLRATAGDLMAEQIGAKLGRTVEQVRGRAKRLGVPLAAQRWARRRQNDRISEAVLKAWRDPEKRDRMLAGISNRRSPISTKFSSRSDPSCRGIRPRWEY